MANDNTNGVGVQRPPDYSDEQWAAYKKGAADAARFITATMGQMAADMEAQTDDADGGVGHAGSGGDAGDGAPGRDADECPDCGGGVIYGVGDEAGVCRSCGASVEPPDS